MWERRQHKIKQRTDGSSDSKVETKPDKPILHRSTTSKRQKDRER